MTSNQVSEDKDIKQPRLEKDGIFDKFIRLDSIFLTTSVLVIIVLWQMNFMRIFERSDPRSILGFFGNYFLPPNTDSEVNKTIISAMIETLQMALVGTYFGFIISLPLSLLAARNLMPGYISTPMRLFLAFVRTVPSLIWALLFVILFGLGPRSGTLALSFYTVGYLGKFQYETFEGLSSDSFEALKALGANKLQLIRYVAIPESANQLISQAIFMLEYNVRSSSIIGFVGAGGIGYLMSYYTSFFYFKALMTALLYILVTVVVIDFIGGKIREQFHDPNFKELSI